MTTHTELPEPLRGAFQNGIPATMISCSPDGIPNTTIISQVYWVDSTHIALSFQFFNKTHKNVRANPHVCVSVLDPMSQAHWNLHVRYDHSETDGPIFDEMDMQIEAIASATGMSGIFKLRAADVYDLKTVEKIPWQKG